MNFHLVVTQHFASFQKGDRITDPALVEKHKNSPFVVKVASQTPATPAAAAQIIKPAG